MNAGTWKICIYVVASGFAVTGLAGQWSVGDFGPRQDQKVLPFIVGNDGISKAFAKRNLQHSTELNVLAPDPRCKDGTGKHPINGVHFVRVNGDSKLILLSVCYSEGVRQYQPEGAGSSYALTQAFLDHQMVKLTEVAPDGGWPALNVEFTADGFRKNFYEYNSRSARWISQ